LKTQVFIPVLARLAAAGMLLWALGAHTRDFYVLLRWVVCGVSGYSAYRAGVEKKAGWFSVFAAIALMYNPVYPVHLTRAVWTPIFLISAAIMFISAFALGELGRRR